MLPGRSKALFVHHPRLAHGPEVLVFVLAAGGVYLVARYRLVCLAIPCPAAPPPRRSGSTSRRSGSPTTSGASSSGPPPERLGLVGVASYRLGKLVAGASRMLIVSSLPPLEGSYAQDGKIGLDTRELLPYTTSQTEVPARSA
jgi:hypothetical protein